MFEGCSNLEYVDARGVKYIDYHKERMDGAKESGNNFINCTALKAVVIGSGYSATVKQFLVHPKPDDLTPKLALYVFGTDAPTLNDDDNLVDRSKIYYYSKTVPTDTTGAYWHYVDGIATLWK